MFGMRSKHFLEGPGCIEQMNLPAPDEFYMELWQKRILLGEFYTHPPEEAACLFPT